jgi:queuine tRNA-ribosyltransferase
MSYAHHLIRTNEIFGLQLTSEHNLTFYLWLMNEAREHIKKNTYSEWYPQMAETLQKKL